MDHRGAPGSGNDGCWALPPFHERAPLASPRGLLDGRRLRCLRLKSSSPCHVVGNSAITPCCYSNSLFIVLDPVLLLLLRFLQHPLRVRVLREEDKLFMLLPPAV